MSCTIDYLKKIFPIDGYSKTIRLKTLSDFEFKYSNCISVLLNIKLKVIFPTIALVFYSVHFKCLT